MFITFYSYTNGGSGSNLPKHISRRPPGGRVPPGSDPGAPRPGIRARGRGSAPAIPVGRSLATGK